MIATPKHLYMKYYEPLGRPHSTFVQSCKLLCQFELRWYDYILCTHNASSSCLHYAWLPKPLSQASVTFSLKDDHQEDCSSCQYHNIDIYMWCLYRMFKLFTIKNFAYTS